MTDKITYRSFEIAASLVSYHKDFDFCAMHEDFDEGDDRYFYGASVEDLKVQIDDWHAENPEEEEDRSAFHESAYLDHYGC